MYSYDQEDPVTDNLNNIKETPTARKLATSAQDGTLWWAQRENLSQ